MKIVRGNLKGSLTGVSAVLRKRFSAVSSAWRLVHTDSAALHLDAQESADFEKWVTEQSQPTEYMRESSKMHQRLRQHNLR